MSRTFFAGRISVDALLSHDVEEPEPATDAEAPPPPTRLSAIERKRAKDRRSQQAKRDRAKQKMHQLTNQVVVFKDMLAERTEHATSSDLLAARATAENKQLQLEVAALRKALTAHMDRDALVETKPVDIEVPLWSIPVTNTAPDNRSDSIWQGLLLSAVAKERIRLGSVQSPQSPSSTPRTSRPNLCPLLDKTMRSDDDITNTICDVITTYPQIGTFTTRVAVANILITLLRWQVYLNEESWNQMPDWLRPIQLQMMVPHATWIDTMPWPKMRKYLIEHPETTIDDLAGIYSSSIRIDWPYDEKNVLLPSDISSEKAITNPVFADHIRQLKNWHVGEPFRSRLPKLTEIVDDEAKT